MAEEHSSEPGENTEIEIPWMISRDRLGDPDYERAYEAARKHGKDLGKAEDRLTMVSDLANVLRTHLNSDDIGVDDCYYSSGVMDILIRELNKARDRIDRHSTCHTNLFLAFALED